MYLWPAWTKIYSQNKAVGFVLGLTLVVEIVIGGISVSTTSAPPTTGTPGTRPPCGAVMGPFGWLLAFWVSPWTTRIHRTSVYSCTLARLFHYFMMPLHFCAAFVFPWYTPLLNYLIRCIGWPPGRHTSSGRTKSTPLYSRSFGATDYCISSSYSRWTSSMSLYFLLFQRAFGP